MDKQPDSPLLLVEHVDITALQSGSTPKKNSSCEQGKDDSNDIVDIIVSKTGAVTELTSVGVDIAGASSYEPSIDADFLLNVTHHSNSNDNPNKLSWANNNGGRSNSGVVCKGVLMSVAGAAAAAAYKHRYKYNNDSYFIDQDFSDADVDNLIERNHRRNYSEESTSKQTACCSPAKTINDVGRAYVPLRQTRLQRHTYESALRISKIEWYQYFVGNMGNPHAVIDTDVGDTHMMRMLKSSDTLVTHSLYKRRETGNSMNSAENPSSLVLADIQSARVSRQEPLPNGGMQVFAPRGLIKTFAPQKLTPSTEEIDPVAFRELLFRRRFFNEEVHRLASRVEEDPKTKRWIAKKFVSEEDGDYDDSSAKPLTAVLECFWKPLLNNHESHAMQVIYNRSRWPSHLYFLLACLSATVGADQLFAYPESTSYFGDATILVPVVFFYIVAALPLVRLELGLGQISQGACIMSFCTVHRQLGVGLSVVFMVSSMVRCYYVSSPASSSLYLLYKSFTTDWTNERASAKCISYSKHECESTFPKCIYGEREGCHFNMISFMSDYMRDHLAYLNESKGFNWTLVVLCILVWVMIFILICNGILTLGYYLSVMFFFLASLSLIMFFIICFSGTSFSYTVDTFIRYFTTYRFDYLLSNFSIWWAALKLCLNSTLAVSGALFTLASYTPIGHNVLGDAWVIILVSFSMSLIYCFIYNICIASLGTSAMSTVLNIRPDLWEMYTTIDRTWGSGYARYMYTKQALLVYASSTSYFSSPKVLAILFFFIATISIMTSVAVTVETVVTSITESRGFCRVKRILVCFATCLVFPFILIIVDYTGNGEPFRTWLMAFFQDYLFASIICFECILCGWIYGFGHQVKQLSGNSLGLYVYSASWAIGTVLVPFLWKVPFYGSRYSGLGMPLITIFLPSLGALIAVAISDKKLSLKRRLYIITLGNIELLRQQFNNILSGIDARKGKYSSTYFFFLSAAFKLSIVWSLCIKYIIPVMSAYSFINDVLYITERASKLKMKLLYGVPVGWLVVGVSTVLFCYLIIIISVIYPNLILFIYPPDDCMWQISDVPLKSTVNNMIVQQGNVNMNPTPYRLKKCRFYEGIRPVKSILPSAYWSRACGGESFF